MREGGPEFPQEMGRRTRQPMNGTSLESNWKARPLRGRAFRLEVSLSLQIIILSEQRQYHLRRHVGLGKHRRTRLHEDLALGKGCHLRRHIHVTDE